MLQPVLSQLSHPGFIDQDFGHTNKSPVSKPAADGLNFSFESLCQNIGHTPGHGKEILDKYNPVSNEIDIKILKSSDKFYIKRFSDAVFIGEGRTTHKNKLIREG